MSQETALVIVAGYQSLDIARRDFQTLTGRTNDKSLAVRDAVLVGKDAQGDRLVEDIGNRLGRRGALTGAGAGFAVGLFSPVSLVTAALGAGAGAVLGTYVNQRFKTGLGDKIGGAMAVDSAVIIVVAPGSHRLAVEQTLAGSPKKSVARLAHWTLRGFSAALEAAMAEFTPDRI
jgi:uncharacterized membrane protein